LSNKIKNPLDFELPLVELEAKFFELTQNLTDDPKELKEAKSLENQISKLKTDTYLKLSPYQRLQLSRHFDRPYTQDYIDRFVHNFVELHGDRVFRDDPAIISGTGKIGKENVVVIGHQRGRTTQERLLRNFGMPQPDGYRKALRMFRLAEKFDMPIICFIDTQGAYPGLEAEERGQAEAIAKNLEVLAGIKVPSISVIIGEGGSGGALALGVTNRILMLSNACYSVISPEGCSSILFKNQGNPQANTATAAENLKINAPNLLEFGIVDEVIEEPSGAAHRNHKETAELLEASLIKHMDDLRKLSKEDLIEDRYDKFRKIGDYN